jgi:hypothetical protein
MRLNAAVGHKADFPLIETAVVAAQSAGSGNDASVVACTLPNMTLNDLPNLLNERVQSALPSNRMRVMQALWINNAANRAGGATNNYDFRLDLYRKGVFQGTLAYDTQSISTTVTAAVSAVGVQAVTPAAMTGIKPGQALYIDSGGTPELVYVISTTATTFTANFASTHSGSYTVTSAHLQYRPIAFTSCRAVAGGQSPTAIAAGSVATQARKSNGLSGLYGLHVGDYLAISGGGSYEDSVIATTLATDDLTATFAQPHAGTYNVGFYIKTTSATAVTGGVTDTITLASAAGIVEGMSLVLQGTGADSAVTDTMTVDSVASNDVTFTAAIVGDYTTTINVTNLAYVGSATSLVAGRPEQTLLVSDTTGMVAGGYVALQALVGNGATGAFTGSAEVVQVLAVVASTSITVSPVAAKTGTYAVIPFTATTSSTEVTEAGEATITLDDSTGFATDISGLYVWGGTGGVSETVQITAISPSAQTFTATYAYPHSADFTYTTATNPNTTNAPNGAPNGGAFEILGGDALVLTRLSNNVTGLASDAGMLQLEWAPSRISR